MSAAVAIGRLCVLILVGALSVLSAFCRGGKGHGKFGAILGQEQPTFGICLSGINSCRSGVDGKVSGR